jgi:amidase
MTTLISGNCFSTSRLLNVERSSRLRRLAKTLMAALVIAHGSLALPSLRAAEFDLATATVADIHAAFKAGALSSEKLTELYLARIAAYDKAGPKINSTITLNSKALELARVLDAEFKAGKIRGPLHGIPVALKDNIDTFDLPTTGGSQLLEGSLPPDDAFITKKLREAGAIIISKVNLSEWAGSGGSVSGATDVEVLKAGQVPNGFSSAGGQTLNPHDLTRGPSGSSGGTGAAIAAGFAQIGLGTDTGGSVRGPSTANGIVGLKPTRGLMSRDGIIPLALSYDTAGPMARTVYDVALGLSVMTGVDKADEATAASKKYIEKDYTKFLKKGSLKGARLGIARDFSGKDAEADRILNESVETLKKLGAEVVDVTYPTYLIDSKQSTYNMLVVAEFKAQVTEYLKTTKPGFPKSYDDLVTLSNDPKTNNRSPGKAFGLKYNQSRALSLTDPAYLALKNEQLAAVKAGILAIFEKHKLDAIVYLTSPRPATPYTPPATPNPGAGRDSATSFANFTGFPDLIVTAGMTKDGLPVAISFFGPAWSEAKLFGYGYDFEQATKAVVVPKHTPALPADKFTY